MYGRYFTRRGCGHEVMEGSRCGSVSHARTSDATATIHVLAPKCFGVIRRTAAVRGSVGLPHLASLCASRGPQMQPDSPRNCGQVGRSWSCSNTVEYVLMVSSSARPWSPDAAFVRPPWLVLLQPGSRSQVGKLLTTPVSSLSAISIKSTIHDQLVSFPGLMVVVSVFVVSYYEACTGPGQIATNWRPHQGTQDDSF